MNSVPYNNPYQSDNDQNDASKMYQQQMLDSLDETNASLNDSVNNALGLISVDDYLSDGLSFMSGSAYSSIQEVFFNDPSTQDTMDSQDMYANQKNQATSDATQSMDLDAENSVALTLA